MFIYTYIYAYIECIYIYIKPQYIQEKKKKTPTFSCHLIEEGYYLKVWHANSTLNL